MTPLLVLAVGMPGTIDWLILLGIVFAVIASKSMGQTRIPTLVLRRFVINTSNDGNPSIEIAGRPSGVVAWVLTVIGLNTETILTVTDLHLAIKSASLSGEFSNFVPLPHVSSTHCGFSKPIAFIILAAMLAIGSVILGLAERNAEMVAILGLVIAGVFLVAYVLSKKITIQIRTDGGLLLMLRFKPSVIEGVPVNIASTIQALSLLNEKVLAAS